MRSSILNLIVCTSLVFATANGGATDLKTTTSNIKRVQKEIAIIKARQKREAELLKWYRAKEAALAKQREKPWQVIPSPEERQHARAAEAIEELIDKEERSIDNYELAIRRYAWAYVVIYDREANKNYLIAKNLVPYIEEGNKIMESIDDAKEAINSAQMTETMSAVGNIFNARSGTVYSIMGSKATVDAGKKAQSALQNAAKYLEKVFAGGQLEVSNEPIKKGGPAYDNASKAVKSAVNIQSLSDAYAQLNKANKKIDIIVTSLVEDVHELEHKNDKIAVDLANKILSQSVAQ